VLADAQIRVLLGVSLLGFGVFVALTTYLQALLAPAGVSATAAAVMLLLLVGTGVLGGMLLPARIMRRERGWGALGLTVLVTVSACLVLAAAPGLVTGLVMSALIGLVLLTALPVILTLVEQRAGDAGATATGLVWLAGNAGGIAAALLVQASLARPGLAFVLLAAVMLVGLPLLLRARDLITGPGVGCS
jgi:predicted MFS family arabinose efflux permease